MKTFLLTLNLILCTAVYSNNLEAGDRCVLSHDLSDGICKSISKCPAAMTALRKNGTRPTICSFEGLKSIICCPLNETESLVKEQERSSFEILPLTTASDANIRISKKKCFEYRVCEIKKKSGKKITYGKNARPGEFPHMAVIGWPKNGDEISWNCGGSLISENYVLTAAHCTKIFRDTTLKSIEPTVVRLGEHDLSRDDDGAKVQDLPIINIIIHPEYAPPNKYHDIALMKLGRDATVRPGCLWDSTNFPDSIRATGWGAVGYMEEKSDILQKVLVIVQNSTACQQSFNYTKGLPDGIIDEQLCAKGFPEGGDTCQGDSGGPLQMKDGDYPCSYHLVGITSFGIGCGTKNIPGVYTRVSSYLDWIEPIVWPNEI